MSYSKKLEEAVAKGKSSYKVPKPKKEVDPMLKEHLRDALKSMEDAVDYINKNKAEDAIEFMNFALSSLTQTKDRWANEGVPKNYLNRMNSLLK